MNLEPQIPIVVRELVDWLALRENLGRAAPGGQSAQRDDERRHLELGYGEAMDQSGAGPDRHRRQCRVEHGHAARVGIADVAPVRPLGDDSRDQPGETED